MCEEHPGAIANAIFFIFGGCILLRSLLGLYYGDRQSQQSFLFFIIFLG
jgi:hypothetical protein